MKTRNQGWKLLANSRKAHYFVDGRSLCLNWGWLGSGPLDQRTGQTPGSDDCKKCWKRARALGAGRDAE